jgi:hemolysin activation/secretion protein
MGRAMRACAVVASVAASGAASLAPAAAQVPTTPANQGLPIGGNALVPQGSPLPRVEPSVSPMPGGVAPSVRLAAPRPVATGSVAVSRVAIVGATVFDAATLAPVTADLAGRTVPLDLIERRRVALLNLYRARGYVFTTVNAAIRPGGAVFFDVVEGHIVAVRLDHDIGPAGTLVLGLLRHLVNGRPVSTHALERWLLLVSDIPGLTVHSVIRPSRDEPGALTLIARVDRKPVSAQLLADNRASPFTGPIEGLAVVNLDSFTQFGEESQLSIYRTFNNTEIFGQASEDFAIGTSGLRLQLYGGAGTTTPSSPLREAGYDGTTRVFGAALLYPVIRSRAENLSVGAHFDAIESDIRTIGSTGAETRASYDSLRVGRLLANYAISDALAGAARPALTKFSARLSQGLPILGSTPIDDTVTPARVGERTNFTKFDGEITRTQTLFAPWDGASLQFVGTLAGQVTGDVLPPAEQYFLGGDRFDRGYFSGEVTGDNAMVASGELDLNTALPRAWTGGRLVASQSYVYYDRGETWQKISTDLDHTLRSAGLGERLSLTRFVDLDLEGVLRLNRHPDSSDPDVKALKGGAFYWQVIFKY